MALGDSPPDLRHSLASGRDDGKPFWRRRPWFLPEGRRLPNEVWQQRHRGLTWLLWAQVPGLFIFGLLRGQGVAIVAVQVGIMAMLAGAAMVPALSRNVRSASTSMGLVVGASVMVHMAGGSIEAHFQYFVVLAFLTLYQMWLPFLLALGYVVVEHGLVGVLDPSAVYNSQAQIAHPWRWASIHGGFVLAASFANVLSWRLTEQQALQDSLTGLPNRVFFLDMLTKTLERGNSSVAVMFIDLDNFKDANDAFGHDFGDELLRALSRRVTGGLRSVDTLARLGGDEFAVALVGTKDRAEARAIAERLLVNMSEPTRVGELSLACYASVGLAFADADTQSAADLLRNADLAMYEAKRGGGGRVAEYQPLLHTVALRRTELDAELRVALEREEFAVHYQPIFEVTTRRLVGTEALVRWQHPTRGLVAPMDFITAAEQSGLIIPLGAWVLRTACMQTAEWQQRHPDRAPLTVSINLSPRQLVDRTLVTTVAEVLHDTGLDPASLCLEITEGSVIRDFDATMPTLHALRTLGVSLALDDFGTGYSSLSYLKQLPVNSVKIDRSFVNDLDNDRDNSQIVLAIIELAHALGMTVTAEGAETEAEFETLRAMHSDHAQGYLLGRPAGSEQLTGVIDDACADAPSVPQQRDADDTSAERLRRGTR